MKKLFFLMALFCAAASFGRTRVVTNEEEFFAALASNTTIVLDRNVHLNLSKILEDVSKFQDVPGRWAGYSFEFEGTKPTIISEPEFDGRQLTLANFKNLTIRGQKNTSIVVEPRYSFCLNFLNCTNCTIENLTIGHTEEGYCSGGVIGYNKGGNHIIKDCDLYGCGTYGVDAMETSNLTIVGTVIRDCSYGIMQLVNCSDVLFRDCDFLRNREYELISGRGCKNITYMDCRMYANNGDSPLFAFDGPFVLKGCEVYHPTENLGTMDEADVSSDDNVFFENPYDLGIKSRGTGPKGK